MKKMNLLVALMLVIAVSPQFLNAGNKKTGATCHHNSDCRSGTCTNIGIKKICAKKGSQADSTSKNKDKKNAETKQSNNNA